MIETYLSIVQVETLHDDELDSMGKKRHEALTWEYCQVIVDWSEIEVAGSFVIDGWSPQPPTGTFTEIRTKSGAVIVIECSLKDAAQAMEKSKR